MLSKDPDYLLAIVEICLPLFRNIPGATELINIAILCWKGNIPSIDMIEPIETDKIIEKIPEFMKLVYASVNVFSTMNSNVEAVKHFLDSNLELFEVATKWIKLAAILLSNEVNDETIDNIKKYSNKYTESSKIYIKGKLKSAKIQKSLDIIIDAVETTLKYADEHQLPHIKINSKLQSDFLQFIVGIVHGKVELIQFIANATGKFDESTQEYINILKKFEKYIFKGVVFGLPSLSKGLNTVYLEASQYFADPKSISDVFGYLSKEGVGIVNQGTKIIGNEVKEKTQAALENSMQYVGSAVTDLLFKDLFMKFDKDKTGYISYPEFCDLCKYMGLHMDEQKSLRIFSLADTNNNNHIDHFEFQNAIVLIKAEIAYTTLTELGLTTEDLVFFGITIFICLLLSLVFIFLGIFAFSKAEGFNAVINSIFPFAAGIIAGSQKINLEESIQKVKDYIKMLVQKFKQITN